jgi:hypothetical protein
MDGLSRVSPTTLCFPPYLTVSLLQLRLYKHIEEGEITQWQKEKEQKNKQRKVHPLNVWSNSNIQGAF